MKEKVEYKANLEKKKLSEKIGRSEKMTKNLKFKK